MERVPSRPRHRDRRGDCRRREEHLDHSLELERRRRRRLVEPVAQRRSGRASVIVYTVRGRGAGHLLLRWSRVRRRRAAWARRTACARPAARTSRASAAPAWPARRWSRDRSARRPRTACDVVVSGACHDMELDILPWAVSTMSADTAQGSIEPEKEYRRCTTTPTVIRGRDQGERHLVLQRADDDRRRAWPRPAAPTASPSTSSPRPRTRRCTCRSTRTRRSTSSTVRSSSRSTARSSRRHPARSRSSPEARRTASECSPTPPACS